MADAPAHFPPQIRALDDWYHVGAGVEHAADFAVDTSEIEFWFST